MMIQGFISLAIAVLLSTCNSKSVPDTRFGESGLIAAPIVTTSPSDPENFTFAFVGDTHVGGDGARFRRILDKVKTENDGFLVVLGDIVDDGKEASFQSVLSALSDYALTGKFVPVIGNHDVFEDGWTSYKRLIGPSHYTMDYGNSRFIVLDTADGTVDEIQREWLEGELKRSRPKNTFILSHYLPVVPGQRTYLKLANEEEALRLMRLVQNHGVRGWLGGHYHSYINETIEGVQYVVAGGGGGRRMEPVKDYFFVQATVSGESVTYSLKTVE